MKCEVKLEKKADIPLRDMPRQTAGILTSVQGGWYVKVGSPVVRVYDEFWFPREGVYAPASQAQEGTRYRPLEPGESLTFTA